MVLFGDPKRGDPFAMKTLAEFIRTTSTSLMVRLLNTGVPQTMLLEQYRMHPDKSGTVSTLFYTNLLRDSPSVHHQDGHEIWRRFHAQSMPACTLRHSVFVHVETQRLFRSTRSKSLVNPYHLAFLHPAIQRLRAAGASPEQIAVLTSYNGQLTMKRNLNLGIETTATIDAAQGKEYDFVVLDLVTPGEHYSFGLMTDAKRACVALSRATFGMIILGNQFMDYVRRPTEGTRLWGTVIHRHIAANAVHISNPRLEVARLMRDLGIPSARFEEVRPGQAAPR